jgi:protein SCO1/2
MGGAAVALIPGVIRNAAGQTDSPQKTSSRNCSSTHNGPYAHYFPNAIVYTHEGQRALFYDDLLRGKTVIINCMSIKNEALFPVTRNLSKLQGLLSARLGHDLFMYSITVDPEHDTPRVLRAFAKEFEARPGWLFLTAEPAVTESLRNTLFMSGAGHDHSSGPVQDCSLGLIRYGNEAVGLWGSVPARSDPKVIATRLSWLRSDDLPASGTPKRRGPMPLAAGLRALPDGK